MLFSFHPKLNPRERNLYPPPPPSKNVHDMKIDEESVIIKIIVIILKTLFQYYKNNFDY